MNLTIQPKLTHSVPFKAQMDESAYSKIIKANPQFKLPDGVHVVNDDTFEKSHQPKKTTQETKHAENPVKEKHEPTPEELRLEQEYNDPNYHGYTEYGTFPTGKVY